MNRWQQKYCDEYNNGKLPRSKQGKADVELLGKIKNTVTVEFPEVPGVKTARTETYIVTEDDCDIPNGKISVSVLISNLNLWLSRGHKITTS